MVQQPLTVQRIAPPPLSLLPLAPPQKADLYHFSSAYAQEDDDDGHRRTSCSSTTTIQVQVKKSPKLGGGEETFTATAEVGPNGTVVKQSQSKGWGRLFGFGGKGGKKARNAVTHDDEACNGPRLNVDVAAEAARRAMIQNLAYMPMPLPPSAANIVVMNDRNADLGAMPDLIFASSTQTTTTTQCSAEGVTTTVTTSMTVAAPVSKGWFGKKKESLHLTDGSTPAAAATPASAPTAAHKPAAALPAEEVDPTKASAEIEKLGWGWGSGAQRIWGPSVSDQAQKRFSEIKDNEGNVLAAQTTVDRSLVPRDSQQVENWKPFVEAYKRGDLDLNNLPAPPNKGVPDASLCPDASPVDCGPLLAPMPEWEKERQLALNRLQFDKLDAARKERIDGYVQELQGYMGTSMSMLALLDEDKMLLPSSCGMGDLKEAPREISICGHTILNRNDGMVVLDVGNDWRFKGGQVSKMGIGFYAGIPVTAANGLPLGSVSQCDAQVRHTRDTAPLSNSSGSIFFCSSVRWTASPVKSTPRSSEPRCVIWLHSSETRLSKASPSDSKPS